MLAGPGFGDFARFQTGAGTAMGFDDLKVIEAAGFLAAHAGRPATNATLEDALSAALAVEAIGRSAAAGRGSR